MWPRRSRSADGFKVIARVDDDPANLFAPCVLIPGKRKKFELGETVILRYADREVYGYVRDWISPDSRDFSPLGMFVIQVRPMPEDRDMLCTCDPGLPDPDCAYHLAVKDGWYNAKERRREEG